MTSQHQAIAAPAILYGTAWKEDRTRDLVVAALAAGFRGLDTANQRKHYHEAAVGEGLAIALGDGALTRGELFVQTKYTFARGQDHRLPYDAAAPVGRQVAQSVERSLQHLGLTWLDSLILHGPTHDEGLVDADLEAWQAMQAEVEAGRVRHLGISNVSAAQLAELCARSQLKPAFVQNRCYASRAWDQATRAVCRAHGVIYQGFSLLTANRPVVNSTAVAAIAAHVGRTTAQVVLRFAQQRGILPLTGTSDPVHMAHDLALPEFSLDDDQLAQLDAASAAAQG